MGQLDKLIALNKLIPPPPELVNGFTGEILDRDDLPSLKKALAEIEAFIEYEIYGKHRALYRTRRDLRERIAELEPVQLPRRSQQTEKQAKMERCPRCRTPLPRVVVEEAE